MLTKDNEDWLALLEGKQVPDAHPDTLEEVSALKTALHTELQWQKLQHRIQAEKSAEKNQVKSTFDDRRVEKFTFFPESEAIYGWLNWKSLTLGVAHTVVVVTVTIFLMLSLRVEAPLPKSVVYEQNSNCLFGYLPMEYAGMQSAEFKQEVLRIKREFISSGTTVTRYEEMNDKTFLLTISLPNAPSKELRQLWDNENINAKLLPGCSVSFIFILRQR